VVALQPAGSRAGQYRFGDFAKLGVPFTVLVLPVTVLMLPWLFPLR
jgi:di/tricarboxylate transporter